MTFNPGSLIAVLSGLAVAPLAYAAEPVKLTKDETQKVLSGKSMNYGGKSGRPIVIFFADNGNVTQRTGNGQPSTGTWTVEDDGRFCIKITKGTYPDVCRNMMRTEAGLALSDAKGNLIPIEGME